MKKIILLLGLALIFSCSSEDNERVLLENYYNPPNWIQGVWVNPDVLTSGFEFRESDFCIITISTVCYKQTYSHVDDFNVYEEISNIRYFTTTTIAGAEYNYEFEKVSENSIKWVNGINNVILVKQ